MSDAQWEGLRVPVDMAFFFYNTPAGKVVAYYPSPMGPTESLLELETWEDLETDNPVLRDMERDVEALLVNRARGAERPLSGPHGRVLQAGRFDPDPLEGLQRRARGLGRHSPVLRRATVAGKRSVDPRREEETDGGHKGRETGHDADAPAHTPGVKGGNDPGGYETMPATSPTARRRPSVPRASTPTRGTP